PSKLASQFRFSCGDSLKPLAGVLGVLFAVADLDHSQKNLVPTPTQAASPTQVSEPSGATSAPAKIRVLVSDSDFWPMTGGSGGSSGAFGGDFSGGANPQTAEILKRLGQRCPNLTVKA